MVHCGKCCGQIKFAKQRRFYHFNYFSFPGEFQSSNTTLIFVQKRMKLPVFELVHVPTETPPRGCSTQTLSLAALSGTVTVLRLDRHPAAVTATGWSVGMCAEPTCLHVCRQVHSCTVLPLCYIREPVNTNSEGAAGAGEGDAAEHLTAVCGMTVHFSACLSGPLHREPALACSNSFNKYQSLPPHLRGWGELKTTWLRMKRGNSLFGSSALTYSLTRQQLLGKYA